MPTAAPYARSGTGALGAGNVRSSYGRSLAVLDAPLYVVRCTTSHRDTASLRAVVQERVDACEVVR